MLLPSRPELPTEHHLLSRVWLGFSSSWWPGTAQKEAGLWPNQWTCGTVLWAESCYVTPNSFHIFVGPGCKLISLMLVRRNLGKPHATGMLDDTGHLCSLSIGGEALSSFHPTQGEKSGVCAAKQLSLCQVLAAPSPFRSSSAPCACQPGPGAMGTARLGKSLPATRGTWGEPAVPLTEHHQPGRGGSRLQRHLRCFIAVPPVLLHPGGADPRPGCPGPVPPRGRAAEHVGPRRAGLSHCPPRAPRRSRAERSPAQRSGSGGAHGTARDAT